MDEIKLAACGGEVLGGGGGGGEEGVKEQGSFSGGDWLPGHLTCSSVSRRT